MLQNEISFTARHDSGTHKTRLATPSPAAVIGNRSTRDRAKRARSSTPPPRRKAVMAIVSKVGESLKQKDGAAAVQFRTELYPKKPVTIAFRATCRLQ